MNWLELPKLAALSIYRIANQSHGKSAFRTPVANTIEKVNIMNAAASRTRAPWKMWFRLRMTKTVAYTASDN